MTVVITGTPAQIAAAARRYAKEVEWLPVEYVRETTVEATAFAPKVTPYDKGIMQASWDPQIDRSRGFTAKQGDPVPLAAAARSTLRKMRPGSDGILANAAKDRPRNDTYANVIWVHGKSPKLPDGVAALERHLDSKQADIARRANAEFEEGLRG